MNISKTKKATKGCCGGAMKSCATKEDANTKTDQAEKKELVSAYVCPMHCEGSGNDAAGKCPTCGMDYVKNEDHKANGHKH